MFPPQRHTQGVLILDDRNVRWLWKGFSDFRLFQRYLDGERLEALARAARTGRRCS
jgi:hypothetical protein